ncbi:hypothetical protein G7059_07985 [Erysipelothrix sp. HDW6A]|uniref:hypothetical protein n=1 Tax=Erysipelothrix sp. HDW6A TaxID=2714928 RepID=UPI00140C98A3|nr:hypothetical protein [Erysipelothrix sp. HDW6A]QIK57781.1 hypothetical protein G7059_07985 [Erysipelothrix sp. HDW6A]
MRVDFKRAHINHAKAELRNYKYLLNVCRGFDDKILQLQTILEGVQSPGAMVEFTTSSGESHSVRQQELRDKLQKYQYDLANVRYRTDRVKFFLENLKQEEREIVTKVYVNRVHIERVALEYFCSEKKLRRRIDDILIQF